MSSLLLSIIGGGESFVRLASSACGPSELRFKRGTTFELVARYGALGRFMSLTGYTLTASIKFYCGGDAIPLTVTIDPDQTANPGRFTISADTEEWPLGCGEADIRFTLADDVFYSTSFFIHIDEPVTVPA